MKMFVHQLRVEHRIYWRNKSGVFFTFVIRTAATGGAGHGVSPNSVDKVFGATATAVDDKDVYVTTATDVIGDGFTAISDGVDGWQLVHIQGVIAQEA